MQVLVLFNVYFGILHIIAFSHSIYYCFRLRVLFNACRQFLASWSWPGGHSNMNVRNFNVCATALEGGFRRDKYVFEGTWN